MCLFLRMLKKCRNLSEGGIFPYHNEYFPCRKYETTFSFKCIWLIWEDIVTIWTSLKLYRLVIRARPISSVGSPQDLRRGHWFDPSLGQYSRIDDIHFDRIRSPLNAVHCFHYGFVGKRSVALKEYCVG